MMNNRQEEFSAPPDKKKRPENQDQNGDRAKKESRALDDGHLDMRAFILCMLFSALTESADLMHRNRNTKKGKAGCWQARLTDCVLGNAVTCQLKKVRGR